MDERRSGAALTGLVVGALVALGFAIIISLLPASIFLETRWRAVVYLVCALAAPPTVWFLQAIARWRHLDQRETFIWGAAGAMTFDGTAIGFAHQLYGQTGQSAGLGGVRADLRLRQPDHRGPTHARAGGSRKLT